MTVACNDCGRPVSSNAKTCPACGAPAPGEGPVVRFFRAIENLLKIVLLLPVLLFFVWIVWAFSQN